MSQDQLPSPAKEYSDEIPVEPRKPYLPAKPPKLVKHPPAPIKLILKSTLCPGDICTLTTAVYSLHAAYPGKFLTDVRTNHPDIWRENPLITRIADDDPDARPVDMLYPQIKQSSAQPINFVSCYTEYLGEQLNIPLRPQINRPVIFLSKQEQSEPTLIESLWTGGRKTRYGIFVSGTKCDYTAKQWPVEYFQEVVDRTRHLIQWVQVGEDKDSHQMINGAIPMVGQTSHRELMKLVFHSSIGLGPATYLLHLCAAFEKPYIYLAGGREPVTWLNYPKMHTLHTVGALSCCRESPCWRSRVVPLFDHALHDFELCEKPVMGLRAPVGQCMTMITPADVVSIVERYSREWA